MKNNIKNTFPIMRNKILKISRKKNVERKFTTMILLQRTFALMHNKAALFKSFSDLGIMKKSIWFWVLVTSVTFS